MTAAPCHKPTCFCSNSSARATRWLANLGTVVLVVGAFIPYQSTCLFVRKALPHLEITAARSVGAAQRAPDALPLAKARKKIRQNAGNLIPARLPKGS